jgi:two-component system sensor kinase FixL
VVLDVTDRRRAEDQAREHLNQLAHVARVASMGEMASAIAHEINQPLTAIANYASASLRLMAAGKMSQAEAIDTMKRLANEAGRAGEVVRKMRGFVRGEEGHLAPVAVDQLLVDVSRLSSPEARQFDVVLETAAAPDLPTVRADAIQVQQVLLNLVRNAMEAIADADSPTRRVTMTAARGEHGVVEIRVADTGPGLAEDRIDKVFEPFYTTKRDGLGIGLALSRSIIDAHGGRLWASAGRIGACFHLTLPSIRDTHAGH